MMSIGESVSTDCMMGTATYAAFTTYTAVSGMTVCGRKYALATASSCASTLAVNGRLPVKPGTT